jgi:hypothetical protein
MVMFAVSLDIMYISVHVEYPLSEMLGTRSVSDFGILAYYNEIAWGWEPNLNAEIHVCFIHSL